MNREELEALCNTNEIEFVDVSTTIGYGMNNKCGNIMRGSQSYPDIIELLLVEENKANYWQRSTPFPMMGRFFPAFGDIYFILTGTFSRRTDDGVHQNVETGYGMYYSRNNYSIEEDDTYYYVTSNYDLYMNTGVLGSHRGMQQTYLRAEEPRYIVEDTTATQLLSALNQENPDPNQGNRYGANTYPVLGPQDGFSQDVLGIRWRSNDNTVRITSHLVEHIFPGIRSHATDDSRRDTVHVSNALSVCTAVAKQMEFAAPPLAGRDHYAWIQPSTIQKCVNETALIGNYAEYSRGGREVNRGYARNNDTIEQVQQTHRVRADAITDGGNHKKHDYLFTRMSCGRDGILLSQLICTKSIPGDMQQMLSHKLGEGSPLEGITLERKVLLSNKAEHDYYSDLEDVVDLTGITLGHSLRLIRTDDTGEMMKGNRLDEICRFDDGVYEAIVDRPMILRRGNIKLPLAPGRYVVTVDSIVNTDFLWYTRITSEVFSDITIEEVSSRLTFTNLDDSHDGFDIKARRTSRPVEFSEHQQTPTGSYHRSRRSRLNLKDIQEDDTVVVDDEERETLE